MLAEEHTTELAQPVGRIVEGAEDRLALGNRERQHLRCELQSLVESRAHVLVVGSAEQPCELKNVCVSIGIPASRSADA